MEGAKDEILENIEDKISSIVDKRNKELEDRRRREFNIVVFNLPEVQSKNGLENKEHDENNMKKKIQKHWDRKIWK